MAEIEKHIIAFLPMYNGYMTNTPEKGSEEERLLKVLNQRQKSGYRKPKQWIYELKKGKKKKNPPTRQNHTSFS